MSTRYSFLLCAFLAISFDSLASDSCGLHAVGLLSSGKTKELAAMFAQPTEVLEQLESMTASLGKISDIQETPKPRFATHKRISVKSKDLPTEYKYEGYWINAQSEIVGALQFQVGRASGSNCKLLVLHLDTEQ